MKLFNLLLVTLFVTFCLTSCSKTDNQEFNQELENVEFRNKGKDYKECQDVSLQILSGMYNQIENVVCCNYDTQEEPFLEIIAFGADPSHDLEWVIQGSSIISSFGNSVLINTNCPSINTCKHLTIQILDHTLKCKSTLNTEICNNGGPCFLYPVEDCIPGESILECFCRKNPFHKDCEAFGGGPK